MLGAEGKGLRQKTRETVTALARLDMPGAIRSLNVSNAAAVALYAARRYLVRLADLRDMSVADQPIPPPTKSTNLQRAIVALGRWSSCPAR